MISIERCWKVFLDDGRRKPAALPMQLDPSLSVQTQGAAVLRSSSTDPEEEDDRQRAPDGVHAHGAADRPRGLHRHRVRGRVADSDQIIVSDLGSVRAAASDRPGHGYRQFDQRNHARLPRFARLQHRARSIHPSSGIQVARDRLPPQGHRPSDPARCHAQSSPPGHPRPSRPGTEATTGVGSGARPKLRPARCVRLGSAAEDLPRTKSSRARPLGWQHRLLRCS